MSTGTRISLAEATVLATELLEDLRPYCERIEIAGSIRRRKSHVGDIEIVHTPKTVTEKVGLFGDEGETRSLLRDHLDRMIEEGRLAKRLDGRNIAVWGFDHQRAVYKGIPLDVFGVRPPKSFGLQLLIRTGSAEFSKRFVTAKRFGGWMPDEMYVKDCKIWKANPEHGGSYVPIDTPEEADCFAAIGREWVEPRFRNVEGS